MTFASLQSRRCGYLVAFSGVIVVALILWPLYPGLRGVTAAAAQLIVVLLVALRWGTGPALLASVLGAVYLNFFYVPPTMKFQLQLADGDDLVALIVYLITSALVGHLSSRAQRRSKEMERLYQQLQASFERESESEGIRRSEKMKSALLDSVTHDLRTPLTSIKAAATALRDVVDSPNPAPNGISQREFLSIIVQQADRLNHFIEGMVELATVEARDNAIVAPQATPVEEIVTAALMRMGTMTQTHNFSVECDENLRAFVHPKAASQVIHCLLDNAARYSPRGTTVRVTARKGDAGGVTIWVEDEGPGIPADKRELVFEKFFRLDHDKTDGLGFGLAIARGIVEAHGGSIEIANRFNNQPGSRVVISLPGVLQ